MASMLPGVARRSIWSMNGWTLQYLIYCAALKRYLASRGIALDGQFGGVRYLFLRGLDGAGNGVWRDKPSAALIAALDGCFDGE